MSPDGSPTTVHATATPTRTTSSAASTGRGPVCQASTPRARTMTAPATTPAAFVATTTSTRPSSAQFCSEAASPKMTKLPVTTDTNTLPSTMKATPSSQPETAASAKSRKRKRGRRPTSRGGAASPSSATRRSDLATACVGARASTWVAIRDRKLPFLTCSTRLDPDRCTRTSPWARRCHLYRRSR